MRAIRLGVLVVALAMFWSCGDDTDGALREPTAEDLPKLVLQHGDVPAGFLPVQMCENQNPPPSADGSSASTFFERVERDSQESSTCIVSYVFLEPSAREATRSMRDL